MDGTGCGDFAGGNGGVHSAGFHNFMLVITILEQS